MKGWQYTTLPGNKKLEENITLSPTIPAPTASSLTKNQLLISVTSAAINPADYKLYESGGLINKMVIHLPGSTSTPSFLEKAHTDISKSPG